MLIALRAILLALFIAAPFGEHAAEADLQEAADDYAHGAVLACPLTPGLPLDLDLDHWTAAGEHATADPDSSGEDA